MSENDLMKVSELIQRVRTVKEFGCQPIICQECKKCTLTKDCLERVIQAGGLSLVHGVAYIRSQQLKDIGIKTIGDLATADVQVLARQWRRLSPCYRIWLRLTHEGIAKMAYSLANPIRDGLSLAENPEVMPYDRCG